MQRLAQVMAGRREKARLARLARSTSRLRSASSRLRPPGHAQPEDPRRFLDVAREVDEQEEGDDGRQRNAPVERIALQPVADHGGADDGVTKAR